MVRFKDIGIKAQLFTLIGVCGVVMLVFGVVAVVTFNTVRIGANLERELDDEKAIIGDFAPSSASLEPAYFLVYRMISSRTPDRTRIYISKFG